MRGNARLLVEGVGGEACDLDGDRGPHGEDERVDQAARSGRRVVLRAEELLPEPLAVLARVLAGDGVEVAEPLHGDEERLVVAEPGRAQLGDLVAEVVLQLVDVVAVDPRSAGDVRTPFGDLRLQALHRLRPRPRAPTRAHPARPDVVQRARDGRPLTLVLGERRPTLVGDRVVPAAAPLGWRAPFRRHVAEPVEAMEQWVEHPVAPLELAPGERAHPLEDRVAVALTVGQDREHERRRRGRDEILVDVHHRAPMTRGTIHRSTRYIEAQARRRLVGARQCLAPWAGSKASNESKVRSGGVGGRGGGVDGREGALACSACGCTSASNEAECTGRRLGSGGLGGLLSFLR